MLKLLADASPTIDIAGAAQTKGLNFAEFANTDRTAGFGKFVNLVLSGAIVIAALAVLIFLVWGAIEYIVAGGDKGKVEAARGKMTGAVVGIIVLSASVAIFAVIQTFLGLNVLTFPGTTPPNSHFVGTCPVNCLDAKDYTPDKYKIINGSCEFPDHQACAVLK